MLSISKKVCLLGDFAVGKTSLVRRFVYNAFDDKYISTIGVKVSRKTVALPCGSEVAELNMLLWDIAGNQQLERMRTSYLRGAAGALLIADLTRPQSFKKLIAYADDLRLLNPTAHFVLGANKVDLSAQVQVVPEYVARWAERLNAPYYITSAKTGEGVEAMFRHMGSLLIS